MHELSICSALLDQVSDLAGRRGASAVQRITIEVGPLSGVEPALQDAETLAFAVAAAHPGVFAPPILRDDLGGAALRRAGLVPDDLGQVLMAREL